MTHTSTNNKVSIFWFRRDLRLEDNVGLYQALQGKYPVLPLFIFDSEILESLPKNDPRVTFIHTQLQKLRTELQEKYHSSLALYHGKPLAVFQQIVKAFAVDTVYTNRDYEPYALQRDEQVKAFLGDNHIGFQRCKDQIIFEKDEVVKGNGEPYLVYTPYKKRWKATLNPEAHLAHHDVHAHGGRFYLHTDLPNLQLRDMGFEVSSVTVPEYTATPHFIQQYEATRNFPAIANGTSRLGPHLRFGTVSIRNIVKKAIAEENEVFWSELIWREFFMQLLWHFPHTVTQAFKPQYERIAWRNNQNEFDRWKAGKTGYALVDAGMRELNATGYMHNRVRMVTASFLCKHLLIDWRWGEAYFAEKLLDYEMASNVGNWQWVAGCGVDAAPYFRIFNPMIQIEKFDKQKEYIEQWIPELQELTYPTPMVDHKMARERCLKVYQEALQ